MGENCDEKCYEGKGGKALFEKEKSQQKNYQWWKYSKAKLDKYKKGVQERKAQNILNEVKHKYCQIWVWGSRKHRRQKIKPKTRK